MRAVILAQLRGLVVRWRQESETMSRRGAAWTAGAVTSCADDLSTTLDQLEKDTRMLTVRQYATLHHVNTATVRKWIARDEIPGAEKMGDGGWRIPASAKRERQRRPLLRDAS